MVCILCQNMLSRAYMILFDLFLVPFLLAHNTAVLHFDILVYESTPAGIMAAVAAARHASSAKVALLAATDHIGGMCSGGLGQTDIGHHTEVIGGLALEFFHRNAARYNTTQPRAPWNLEPHVAKDVFISMLSDAGVKVFLKSQVKSVNKSNGKLISMSTTDGRSFFATYWIDASYEGDLLARAGVSFAIGREPRLKYNESHAGNMGGANGHEFNVDIDPLDASGHPLKTRLLTSTPAGDVGDGDTKIQAYNFRLCVTKKKDNMLPFTKPDDYNPDEWELARRWIAAGTKIHAPSCNTQPVPNGKYDMNNCGAISSDMIGWSWKYPTANYSHRQWLFNQHLSYTQGLLWFFSNDSSVPESVRESFHQWGLCKDEFTETDGWPPQLYVREGRRIIGEQVFTQVTLEASQKSGDIGNMSIGMGSYNYDSHNAQRYACVNKTICKHWEKPYTWNEGDLETAPGEYQIPLSVLLPTREEGKNLLVPVCVSASHVAYATLRMEPQFMIMGHSAGVIASLSLAQQSIVHDVDTAVLHSTLVKDGQVLSLSASRGYRCLASRCVNDNEGTFTNSSCEGQCVPIASNEWFALKQHWGQYQSSTQDISSVQDTFLKKNEDNSKVLPPSLKIAVPTKTSITLHQKPFDAGEYWLVECQQKNCGIHSQ